MNSVVVHLMGVVWWCVF